MQMTDYNVRDVFFLFTGRCGHGWVGVWNLDCPTCGAFETDFAPRGTLDKVTRQINQAIRNNRRKKRKTAAIISLASHRPQPEA
jgi:hypothetical protein